MPPASYADGFLGFMHTFLQPILRSALLSIFCWTAVSSHAQSFPDTHIAKQQAGAERGMVIDAENLAEGQMMSVKYVDRLVYPYRRTAADIEFLKTMPQRALNDDARAAYRREYSSSTSEVLARLLMHSELLSNSLMRSYGPSLLAMVGWSPVNGCALVLTRPADRSTLGTVFRDHL